MDRLFSRYLTDVIKDAQKMSSIFLLQQEILKSYQSILLNEIHIELFLGPMSIIINIWRISIYSPLAQYI